MITIHYDYTDGTEVSYIEGVRLGDNFTTTCTSFFSFMFSADVRVLKKDSTSITKSKLLANDSGIYSTNNIKGTEDIEKMLLSNVLIFRNEDELVKCKSFNAVTDSMLTVDKLNNYIIDFYKKITRRKICNNYIMAFTLYNLFPLDILT